MLKLVDLCAGTGTFSKVFLDCNIAVPVFSNDIDKNSKLFYDQNIPHKLTLKDIKDINIKDIPDHDILTAGFPCQPFSLAGEKLGFDDVRSNVFFNIVEILEKKKPRFFILENVKNILRHDPNTKNLKKNEHGETFKRIKEELTKIGYHFHVYLLNTKIVTNIPQNRERVYIVGFKSNKDFNKWKFEPQTIQNKEITELLDDTVDQKYFIKQSKILQTNSPYDKLNEAVKQTNVIYQYRRHTVRENKNNVCPTLTANMGSGGHNVPFIMDSNKKKVRKLTPNECFKFQGFDDPIFPDKMSDAALYKLAGNAVSYPVVKLLAESLKKMIN